MTQEDVTQEAPTQETAPDNTAMEDTTPQPQPQVMVRRPPSVLKELATLFLKIAVIVLLTLLTFTFVYGFHRVSGPHMSPMVNDGDLLLFFRLSRSHNIDDLVLLSYSGERQVRRIVAQAGDTVNITHQGLIVNGAAIHEPMIFQDTWRLETAIQFPLTVGPGQIFVLGDARETAIDSRAYGPINISDTLGTVITVIRRRGM